MALSAGTCIGPYEVIGAIGAGGMGEVYRARDLKLKREVALKTLPGGFALDSERLARFRREAHVLAALNHPNIGHIYGLEDAGPSPALVLELVEGPTLADRLAHGPLALADALQVARQIALALEAAHEQNVIHRDLKPSNVKVRDDGTVKVLDFGLAKALGADATGAASDMANSPTLTNRATALGVILGTAAYMAPEQAKGKTVDKRADIWSFGVVLFEMLTGRRLFHGEDVSDTLAEVLKKDIDWQALPASTPPAILRLLHRCLERDPRQRLHDIADARMEIEEALAAPRVAAPAPTVAATPRRERWLRIAALGATAAASAAMVWWIGPPPSSPPETRLQIVTPPTRNPMSLAVSPDGRTVAFLVTTDEKTEIWTRPLDAEGPRPLPGADVAPPWGGLWWSSDGRSLFFIDAALLKQIPSGGGTPHVLPDRLGGFGASWNAEGTVLFAPANGAPIYRIRAGGGAPEEATRVVAPQVGHRFPFFLPDGRHFLFLATGPARVQGIYVGTLDSKDARLLVLADTLAQFLPPDWVLFGRQDALLAQRVNADTWEALGEPQFIAGNVLQQRTNFGSLALAVSAAGTLAYRERVAPRHRLLWFDRSGREVGRVGDIDTSEIGGVRLSPDGRTIALARRVNGNTDLWTIDNTKHGALQRLTSDPATDVGPAWSPDGSHIGFYSSRRGGGFYGLHQTTLGNAGAETVLLESPDNTALRDWSHDNRFILYAVQSRQQAARDLWALPLGGQGTPIQVTSGPYDEPIGRFSADTHWVAYQSTVAGGGADIYVRPFPGPGREWRISTGGGTAPSWRQDGREIYYLGSDNRLMAVTVTLPATATGVVEHGAPTTLFALRGGSTFDPAPDGQTFLVDAVLDDLTTPPITVILNWRGK